jgi:hypothetical protein
MEALFYLLGLLFVLFLVLSAAVEAILDMFRGLLERFGIALTQSKVSLEEALELARVFAQDESALAPKLQAVESAAKQIEAKVKNEMTALASLKQKVATLAPEAANVVAAELNAVASSIKAELEKHERQRVFILRTLSALIGCLLTWQTQFFIFKILVESPDFPRGVDLPGLKSPVINIIIGGFAAAAGSSFWHDQLDKVRNLKAITQGLKKL